MSVPLLLELPPVSSICTPRKVPVEDDLRHGDKCFSFANHGSQPVIYSGKYCLKFSTSHTFH